MKNQETEDQRDQRLALSVAQLLWDLEETGVSRGVPATLTFTWEAEWGSYNGQFLCLRRLVLALVTASWRYGRPPTRPNADLVWDGLAWDGRSWRSQEAVAEAQEASR